MCKNDSGTRALKIQFIPDEHVLPVPLTQREYISEFMVQGIGLIPDVKKTGHKIRPRSAVQEYGVGQKSLSPIYCFCFEFGFIFTPAPGFLICRSFINRNTGGVNDS